jgi:NAD-dependent deacetylase
MLIIGGTSLTVYPAAGFVNYFRGKNLVVINRDPLNVRIGEKVLTIQQSIGEVFSQLKA